jgi:hypothetical protein
MSHLSNKTLTTYRSTINSLYKKIGLGDTAPLDSGKWIETNFKKIMDYIDAMKSDFSKKNNTAILKVWSSMFHLNDKILNALDKRMGELAEAVNSTYSTNQMNEKTLNNWVGVDGLKEKVLYLQNKLPSIEAIDTYREYMLLMKYLCLLIHINAPMRNDLADAKLVTSLPAKQDEDVNYVLIGKRTGEATIYLNNYKTKKEYGEKIIKLPSDVAREIVKYSDVIARMSPHGWFIGKDGEDAPISRPTYTKLINSIFSGDKIKVGSTQIRRAVVSSLYQVDEDEYKKKAELANVMGHSPATGALVYAKVIPKELKGK